MFSIKPFLSLTFFLLLCACQTLPEKNRMSDLSKLLENYALNYRWGSLNALNSYKKPSKDKESVNQTPLTTAVIDKFKNIRVVNYDIIVPPVIMSEMTVVQQVRVDYVYVDSQSVKSLIDRQIWEYDEDESRWYRITDLPKF